MVRFLEDEDSGGVLTAAVDAARHRSGARIPMLGKEDDLEMRVSGPPGE